MERHRNDIFSMKSQDATQPNIRLDSDTHPAVIYKQLNDISNDNSDRNHEQDTLLIGSFNEFLKNTQLDEQPGDVPDILDLEAAIRFLR